jgi:hypothetical protein
MQTPKEAVLEAAANLCYHDSIDSLTGKSGEYLPHTSALLTTDGVVKHVHGQELSGIAGISLSALLNNVSEFFRLLNRREFKHLLIVVRAPETVKLNLTRSGSSDFEIELLKQS